jgi:hypothetical protein
MVWRKLYVAALMETDDEKMFSRIAEAEGAIVARVRKLFTASGDNVYKNEEEAMHDALYALNALKSCVPRPESGSHAKRFYQMPDCAAFDNNAHDTRKAEAVGDR